MISSSGRPVRPWAGRLSFLPPLLLIGEQLLYAGANFGVTALLARHLSVQEFAIYATGYSLTMLLTALHQGTMCDALFVFPQLNRAGPRRLWALISAGLFVGLVTFAAAGFALGGMGAMIGVGLAIFAPASVNQYLRRRNQANGRYASAFSAGAIYAVVVCGATWFLADAGAPAWQKMIVPQFAGFLAAGFVNATAMRLPGASAPSTEPLPPGFWRSLVGFSFFLALNNVIGWLPPNIYQWFFALSNHPFEASVFRIIQTMFIPYFQILGALSGPISQHFSRNGFDRKAMLALSILLPMPLVGAVFLYLVGSPLITLIFGPKFQDLGPLAAFASLGVVPAFAASLFGSWLRARHVAWVVVVGSLVNIAILMVFGLPVATHLGLFYVFGTIAVGYLSAFVTMVISYRVWGGKSRAAPPSE